MARGRNTGGSRTFGAAFGEYARALGQAIGAPPRVIERAEEIFGHLGRAWADEPVGEGPAWPSDICDDGSPFELSAAFDGGRAELRALVEPQTPPRSLESNWSAGLEVARRLEQMEGASLRRFSEVAELFSPSEGDAALFALWYAVVLGGSGEALFKAYFNPRVHGPERAPDLLREALERLGLGREAPRLAELVGDDGDALRYFSLDLAEGPRARVKLYVARSDSALAVERLLTRSRNFEPGLASDLLFGLTGHLGPYDDRPILVCFAFDGAGEAPNATLHIPIRCYAASDEEALRRVTTAMRGREARMLWAAAEAVAGRPLWESRGVLTYASLRPGSSGLRTTAYLAPMLYSGGAPRTRRDSSAPAAIL